MTTINCDQISYRQLKFFFNNLLYFIALFGRGSDNRPLKIFVIKCFKSEITQ